MKNSCKLFAISSVVGFMVFTGCNSNTSPIDSGNSNTPIYEQAPSTQSDSYFDRLAAQGFDRNDMIDIGDKIIVEGDIVFNKSDILTNSVLGKTTQRNVSSLISTANTGNIRLRIHSSMSDWSTIIQDAVSAWNSVRNCQIHIEIVTSSPELTIWSDADPACPSGFNNLASNVCGLGAYSTNNNVGPNISINKDQNVLNTDARRLYVITHEIGHAIGLAHTNESDGIQIVSTPTTDDQSLMLGGDCGTTKLLSFFDRVALLSLYPTANPEDIVWQHSSGQVHYWSIQNGQRTDGNNIYTPVGSDWTLRGVGDLDANGFADIVWQHSSGQVHYWPIQNGQRMGGYDISSPVGSDWTLRAVADMNGDGTDDIVWQHSSGQVHYWPILNGQRIDGYDISSPVGSDWTLRAAADMNGDGTDDIIWQHSSGQVHYWPILNGQRIDGYDISSPVGSDWTLRGAGDVNGDGTDDIIWQHSSGLVHYWPMQDGQRMGGFNIFDSPVGSDWTLCGVGNIN